MAQDVRVYCNEVVEHHPLNTGFSSNLEDICIRDYGQGYCFSSLVKALDLDAAEKASSGTNDKTMDAAIGIADYISNSVRNSRLALVELRLNYTGQAQNSRTSDMKAKERHSRQMLSPSHIDSKCYFVFSENVAPCKRSTVRRESIVDSDLKNWEICSPDEFTDMFHHVSELPYDPISPVTTIIEDGVKHISNCDYTKVIEVAEFWLKKIDYYYNRYNKDEMRAISQNMESLVKLINQERIHFEDDEDLILRLMIVEEQLECYLASL